VRELSESCRPAQSFSGVSELVTLGREVIHREASALERLADSLGESFADTLRLLAAALDRGGRILLTGVGKSGLAARKIASTLCSTGAPAFFIHPQEASHGDLGLLTERDVLIAISRSGNAEALEPVLSAAERLGVPVIGWTSDARSPLALTADVAVNLAVGPEADPEGIVPSTSSTATIAFGDAVAIALYRARGLTASDFASLHPGGALGRKLTLQVHELMRRGDELPLVRPDQDLLEVLQVISEKRLGVAIVVGGKKEIEGVLTDGDVRRALLRDPKGLRRPVCDFMTRSPRTIGPNELIARAIQRMETRPQITSLVVVNESGCPIGVLHLHDCLQAGLR
jgi:arabinose-5-phosphate isomerase